MNKDNFTSWGQDRRLDLSVQKSLEDASTQWKTLIGRDRLALQMEWIEFLSDDWQNLDVEWANFWMEW